MVIIMAEYKAKPFVLLVFAVFLFVFCCFGCTKDDVKGEIQKIVGNAEQGGNDSFEFGGGVTNALPNAQNTHFFGDAVTLEMVTGDEEYTVRKMTVLNSLESENFSFPDHPIENGWVSKDGVLNPDYSFVLVELTVKKVTKGEIENEATLVNKLSLVYESENGDILPAGEMDYFQFTESDGAKRSTLANEYFGVYLDVGASIDCRVGYFVPKNTVSDTGDLFFSLGINPEKTQYIRQ